MFFFGGVKFSEKVGNPLNIAAEYRRHSEDACRPCSAVMKCVKYLPWGLTHGYLCKGFLSEGRMYGCYYFTIAVTITMTIGAFVLSLGSACISELQGLNCHPLKCTSPSSCAMSEIFLNT